MSSETTPEIGETPRDQETTASTNIGSEVSSKVIAGVVFFGLAVFYLINALLLPNAESEDGVGPKTFPVAVGIVLMCTTVLGLVSLLRGRVSVRPVTGNELLRVLACIVLFALFTASIFLIGFAEAAAVFSVLTTMLVFGVRMKPLKVLWVLFIGLVIGMLLFLVFDIWLNVLLPVGWLEYLVFGGMNL